MANERSYTLTDEQLKALISEVKGQQAANVAPTPGVNPLTPDDQVAILVAQMKEGEGREQHKIEEIACVSPETGSSFLAVVATSKSFPAGRVVALKDYQYPEGTARHVSEGGAVPEGLTIKLPSGEPDKMYKQWRWENYWKADLTRYVGKDAAWLRRMIEIGKASAPAATI